MKTLADAKPNRNMKIKSVQADTLTDKFYEMGFVPDSTVKLIYRAPLGDPLAVNVGNSTVMLRKSEAASIEIEELD